MNPVVINLVFEDTISEVLMLKIISAFSGKYYHGISYSANGFGYIKSNIAGFNEAAAASVFFVLTDLDKKPCPISLKSEWLVRPQKNNLIFRIAVREIESWLIADRQGMADYLGISIVNIPQITDIEVDPKITLINLARRSRKRIIKEDIIPINDRAKVGPNYNERLAEFVHTHWDMNRARESSESLDRAIKHLERFEYEVSGS